MRAAGSRMVRPPVATGTFYEPDPAQLRAWLGSVLADARARGPAAAAWPAHCGLADRELADPR